MGEGKREGAGRGPGKPATSTEEGGVEVGVDC